MQLLLLLVARAALLTPRAAMYAHPDAPNRTALPSGRPWRAIDRVPAAEMTAARFRTEYFDKKRPVIVVGAHSARVLHHWDFDTLIVQCGSMQLDLHNHVSPPSLANARNILVRPFLTHHHRRRLPDRAPHSLAWHYAGTKTAENRVHRFAETCRAHRAQPHAGGTLQHQHRCTARASHPWHDDGAVGSGQLARAV